MLNDFMVKVFGLNWRTTLAGIILATGNVVMDYSNGVLTFRTFAISFSLAVAGYIIKDAKVTGTELNPRAQIVGHADPLPTPAAAEKIAAIEETKKP